MSRRRVVITGMGIVSPVGCELDAAWKNVCEGVSGIQQVEDFDASEFPTRIGGIVKGFELSDYLSTKDARKTDPFVHYGIGANSVDAFSND